MSLKPVLPCGRETCAERCKRAACQPPQDEDDSIAIEDKETIQSRLIRPSLKGNR